MQAHCSNTLSRMPVFSSLCQQSLSKYLYPYSRSFLVVNLMVLLGHNLSSLATADAVAILMQTSAIKLHPFRGGSQVLEALCLLKLYSVHVEYCFAAVANQDLTCVSACLHSICIHIVSLLGRSCSSVLEAAIHTQNLGCLWVSH